jgi:hypothetical protein
MSAPLVKFETGYSADSIKQIEIERETAQCVWLYTNSIDKNNVRGTRRSAKRDSYAQYHDTWGDAHAFLIAKAEGNVAACRRSLESANGKLGNIKGMKPPAA